MIKSEKGNAMLLAIIAFAVIFIFTTTAIILSDSNLKHTIKEQKKTEAYYVAKTGVESIIKYLNDEVYVDGDMRDEIIDLIGKTDAGDRGKGSYKNGEFEISVEKEIRKDSDGKDKTVYLIKSKGEVKEGKNTGKDQITAVLTPEYEVEKSWGNGTVDVGKNVYLAGLNNLKGSGLTISTEEKRTINGKSPIWIQSGLKGEEIQGLFDAGGKDKIISGYRLSHRTEDSTHIHSERLINDTISNFEPIQLNYGVKREKPKLIFPSSKGGEIKLNNVTIDVNSPNVGKLVTEKYEVIDFDKNGNLIKEVKDKEVLKIDSSVFEISGNNTIQTSSKRDVVIVTDVLNVMANTKINVKGNGMVYFYISSQPNLYGSSEIGVNIDKPEEVNANSNIHFYLKPNIQMKLEDNAQAKNIFVYGPEARIELDGGAVFRGRMMTGDVSLNGECTIQSPVDGKPNEETSPIIGFESIEWER